MCEMLCNRELEINQAASVNAASVTLEILGCHNSLFIKSVNCQLTANSLCLQTI